MLNRGMLSSATDLWETPQDFFDQLDKEFDFDLDTCALEGNAKCTNYYTPEQDGLSLPWTGTVWCNPPYGRQIGKWVEKAARSAAEGATVVMLLPARTDTRWFHKYIYQKAEIRFVSGRLKFGGSKSNAPFPSMVCVFRGGYCDLGRLTMALIEREALMDAAEWDTKTRTWSIPDAQLNRLPTIDPIHAAGGRYCRECTYYETGTDDLPYCNCPDGGIADYPKPDDFCSYGLPKEDLS